MTATAQERGGLAAASSVVADVKRALLGIAGGVCWRNVVERADGKIGARVTVDGRAYRGLRPFKAGDAALLEAVVRREFTVSGFRNRDLRALLAAEPTDVAAQRRTAARVSRQLAMLQAPGLTKKIPRTHRYELTDVGRTTITALLAARNATPRLA